MNENKKPTYLICITANNNNKYYRMIPKGDTFDVEYGRVGATCQKSSYPISSWNKKYNEKIKKGYVDQSDLIQDLIVEEKKKSKSDYKEIENKVIADIVARLQDMANKTIQKNYKIESTQVTQAMVDKAQSKIDDMTRVTSATTVEMFNKDLIELFGIIPRKMGNVSDYLAKNTSDFGEILKNEQDLLDVMRGQVVQHITQEETETEDESVSELTVLEAMGLVFEEVDERDIKKIKTLLGDSRSKFKRAWKVTNLKTQKKFDDFVNKENITNIKQLWHGSRNENWWSIINTGLVLRPAANVVRAGHMLGYGLYYAPRAKKSIGYTSLQGSYWAGGSSASGFMAVMDVAYGKPYDVNSFDSRYYDMTYEKLQKMCPGANCLHAHAGLHTGRGTLRNDEIVIYKEEQCTIKYLVEIA
jgi:poly [ADP-ribose] polymerase